MQVADVVKIMEQFAPSALKEDFDNVGLLVGDKKWALKGVLVTLDVTEAIVEEALEKNCNLIVAHHPIILSGIKRIVGSNEVERVLLKAIKNDIAIFAAHTNADNVMDGVSGRMCDKLGLINRGVLDPKPDALVKLVTFVPTLHAEQVREAMFAAGAGSIGNYDSCSFNVKGQGTFRAGADANPYVGNRGELHQEEEVRIETVVPAYLQKAVVAAMVKAHPYEEVAYDCYSLNNEWATVGSGMIGELPEELPEEAFLKMVKEAFNAGCVRYTPLLGKPVKKVALCGGSGSFLLGKAKAAGADVFITGDFKYHQFFDADGQLVIADIGHFESEQFTKEVFFELLTKKISNFAVHLSNVNTNPVKYL